MSPDPAPARHLDPAPRRSGGRWADSPGRALEQAVDCAVRPPSVHDSQPWRIELRPDRMVFRVDRTGRPTTLDPIGRELVQRVGAALFNVRVALAARGWAAEVHRFPGPADPDLLAEVTPYPGMPEAGLAPLESAILQRPTNRRRFTGGQVPDEVLRRLTEIAEGEGVLLVPVVHESHRRLVARLTRQADRLKRAAPADRGGRRWDGLPPDADETIVLLATRGDDQCAWLRAGEALQHVLLELTRLNWEADPLPQAIDVPLTRTQLRAALTWDSHPQMLVRIGRAPATVPSLRRWRGDIVVGAPGPAESVPVQQPSAADGPSDGPVR